MIRPYKIGAMLYADLITFTKTKERMVEYLFFPITSTIIWALFAKSIFPSAPQMGLMFLIINIFWSFSYHAQSAVNLQINMDVWSRSLNQILVSGISELEFITSRLIFATCTSLFIATLMLGIASTFSFALPPISALAPLVLVSILAASGWSVLVVALYLLLGKDYAFLSWSFFQLVVLFSAPFFPIAVYPLPLQYLARLIPQTWIFESIKQMSTTGTLNSTYIWYAFLLSLILFAIVFPLYIWMFRQARKTGALVRLGF